MLMQSKEDSSNNKEEEQLKQRSTDLRQDVEWAGVKKVEGR
jgi:hypothetical protein